VISDRTARVVVFAKTLAACAAYAAAIFLADSVYFARRFRARELSIGVSVAFVQCAVIFCMLTFSFLKKWIEQVRDRNAERLRPRIRELLAKYAAQSVRPGHFIELSQTNPSAVEACLLESLRAVRGSGRQAISRFAGEIGLHLKWQKEYGSRHISRRKNAVARLALLSRDLSGDTLRRALADPDESVRLHTARAVLQNCHPGEAGEIFRLAVEGSDITRIILSEELRPYILELVTEAIPAMLGSPDSKKVLATLEILDAWGKFLPLTGIYPLLRNHSAPVRAAAFRLLTLVPRLDSLNAEILHGVSDSDPAVCCAAAGAAASVGLQAAVPELARCLHQNDPRTAPSAAQALARLGEEGCRMLERETLNGSPLASAVALEALESARTSRLEMVGAS